MKRQQCGNGTLVQVVDHVRRGEEGEAVPLGTRRHRGALVDHLSHADQQWYVSQAISLVVAVSLLTAGPAAAASPAGSGPRPDIGTVHVVGRAAQDAARAFWTASRMAQATGAQATATQGRARPANPPPGTPSATPFDGVPTVGTLFYTTGSGAHFCTASVVDSERQDLIVTAAHCVYSAGYSTNIEFVPGYHDGRRPYGAWLIQAVVVAKGWRQWRSPDLDFAFLTVVPLGGSGRPIQRVTGGLRLGIGRGYAHPIRVIGYNDHAADPVRCATNSFEFRAGQMEFYCHGYRGGTSGGPWVIGYTGRGTGTLFGVIGGYEDGGDYDWASYSAVLGTSALDLFRQAEAIAALQ
jgi:V8-like Glu-specific endopeptidase